MYWIRDLDVELARIVDYAMWERESNCEVKKMLACKLDSTPT